jgi:transposase
MPKTLKTSKNIQFVKDNYLIMTGKELGAKLGVSRSVIYSILKEHGLKITREMAIYRRSEGRKKPITKEEIQYIHEHIKTDSIKTMAAELRRFSGLISATAHELGYSQLIEQRAMDSRLQKGHIPPNKGKKITEFMTPEQIERTKVNRFKKGHKPANTLAPGEVVIVHDHPERPGSHPYKRVGMPDGKSKFLHRQIWKKEHGEIPKGMNIVFKDGDSLNCELSNLEMISNAENMKRNTIHNYPPEFKTTLKLISKIKDHE